MSETRALLEKAVQGDREAREAWMRDNMALVYALAKRIPSSPQDREDIIQAGFVGMTQALNQFDLSRGVAFSTYAVPFILGEMRAQARRASGIKTGRRVRSQAAQVMRERERLEQQLRRQPTVMELSEACGLSREDIVMSLEAFAPALSLENDPENAAPLQISSPDDLEGEVVDRISLPQMMERLDERQRKIIYLRYFNNKTQSEIGKDLGISQVQVSRIEKKGLEQLKRQLL